LYKKVVKFLGIWPTGQPRVILEETAGEEILRAETKYRARVKHTVKEEQAAGTVLRLVCGVMDRKTEELDIIELGYIRYTI
jgi:hypothetical protein